MKKDYEKNFLSFIIPITPGITAFMPSFGNGKGFYRRLREFLITFSNNNVCCGEN